MKQQVRRSTAARILGIHVRDISQLKTRGALEGSWGMVTIASLDDRIEQQRKAGKI